PPRPPTPPPANPRPRPRAPRPPSPPRLWAGVLEAVHLRVELFGLELGEELRRLGQLAISAVAVVFALFMLVLSANVVLLAVFWDTHRVAVAVASCLFYALVAAAAALVHGR